MFMTPALRSVSRDTDSGFGLMHLNALNGSSSINSEAGFGPRNYVNDEHISATFFENFKYYPKECLKSPSLGRIRASSPNPAAQRSRVKSPYLPRKSPKTNKYEVDVNTVCDEPTDRNLLRNSFIKNKFDMNECQCMEEKEARARKNNNSPDLRVTKSLNFDSLSLYSSPCKENKKSVKRQNKQHRCQTN